MLIGQGEAYQYKNRDWVTTTNTSSPPLHFDLKVSYHKIKDNSTENQLFFEDDFYFILSKNSTKIPAFSQNYYFTFCTFFREREIKPKSIK